MKCNARTATPTALAVLICLAASPGCNTSSEGKELRLIASARPYESDIPLPAGFRIVDEASEDRSTGVSRLYLRHVYRGQADKHAVRNFYREQMPLARWVKASDGNVGGRITMRFEKGHESCTIEIRDVDGGLRDVTEIQVLVSQEQRGPGTGERRNRKRA